MDFLNIINTFRKFGNFLAGLFPVLGVLANRIAEFLKLKGLNDKVSKLRQIPPFRAFAPIVDRFFWKDYAKDRLEIENLAPEMVPILKVVAGLSVGLLLLMPLSNTLAGQAVKIPLSNGIVSEAPAWVVWCWLGTAAFAWACLSTGAAISNRWVMVLISNACLYFLGSCALFMPRSYWNCFLGISIILGVMISSKVMSLHTWKDKVGAIIANLMACAPSGLVFTALTPLHHFVKPFVLQWGGIIGGTAGIASLGTSRETKSDTQPLRLFVILLTTSSSIFLASLALRGGLSPVAEQLISSLKLWNGYLWPLWYYIGIGIIFKLLKNARIISRAVQDGTPKFAFKPLSLLALLAGLVIFWSPVLSLAWYPPHPLAGLSAAFIPVYQQYRTFLNDPTNVYTSEWMRWVFAIDAFIVCWLLLRKQLSSNNLGTLVYFTILGWILIAEYTFQISSFSHSPKHSAALVALFGIWLLWLFHTSILELCSESTKRWPAQGRQLLYSGFVCLCLLETSARTVVKDFNVSNEIFLMMFRGIIDVGIPYFLYVFATRRLTNLPIRTLALFQAFCLGLAFTLPLNVLDKLCISGNLHRLFHLWQGECEVYRMLGIISTYIPHLPNGWLAVRAMLFTAAISYLSAVVFFIRNSRSKDPHTNATPKGTYAATAFLLFAFAGGVASFSKTAVELPLPTEWKVLLSPFCINFYMDYHWLSSYLSAWISTLAFLVLMPLSRRTVQDKMRLGLAMGACGSLSYLLTVIYPGKEYELLSANVISQSASLGVIVLVYLGYLVWSRTKNDLRNEEPSPDSADMEDAKTSTESDTAAPVFSFKAVNVIALCVIAFISLGVASTLDSSKLKLTEIAALHRTVAVPSHWITVHPAPIVDPKGKTNSNASDGNTKQIPPQQFYTLGETELKSFMQIGQLQTRKDTLSEAFNEVAEKVKQTNALPDFQVKKTEGFASERGKQVLLATYTYSSSFQGSPIIMTGLTALVKNTQSNTIEFATIYSYPNEFQRRESDIHRIIDAW